MASVELFSKLLLKYSAYMSSKKTGTRTSRVKTFLTDKLRKYEESLSSYTSACQEDPDLKSFDSSLHGRTSKLFRSLAGRGGQTENSSLDSLKEVCEFQGDLSQDVLKIIIDNKEYVSKNEELKSLVDLYFESTTKTLNLFNTVEKCVEKAKISQLIIRVAIELFETESMDTDFGGKKKKKTYAETLEKLNKVKAMEDPFGDEFATQYESIYEEQVMLLDKFRELQVVLKKHKNLKKLMILGNIVFASALVSVIALSMVATLPVVATVAISLATSMGFSPVVATVAMSLTTPISIAGTWVFKMLKDYEKSVKTQKDLLLLTEKGTRVNIESMKTIKNLVETLITRISSILKTVEVAVENREEEAMKLVMQEIIKKVEGFAEKIEEVGANVAKCSKLVVSGRLLVLEHIANSDSSKGKW